MQLTSNIWSTFPFWKRFIADGDVKLKFLINFWTNLFNIYNKNEYEKHKFKKKYIIKWRLAKNVQNINYISYILYAKYIFKCFSVMSIETQFRKRTYTFCNCLCLHGNLLIENSFELMGYFKHRNACFSDDLLRD